jgi:pimeloyl-ACP methyl ester carboxylesterase
MDRLEMLDRGDGTRLAYALTPGAGPTVVVLPGFRSDMSGDKATDIAGFCAARGQACLRLDYSGHGASEGRFEDGTIGRWTQDALAVIDRTVRGKVILVGASMGGWIALLAALARPARVAGLLGIAAAPDFTQLLIWQPMSFADRAELMRAGVLHLASRYGDPLPITRALIEDGRDHLLLARGVALTCPVRLLHGQRDEDVPWELSLRLADRLAADDVAVTLVKDGDHRLSRPQDLALLRRTLAALLGEDRGQALPVGPV